MSSGDVASLRGLPNKQTGTTLMHDGADAESMNIFSKVLWCGRLATCLSFLGPVPVVAQGANPSSIPRGSASISGRLLDALTKQPIAGCSVSLNELYLTPSRNARTTTDSDGGYAFTDIADGQYHVNTWCERHLQTCYRSADAQASPCDAVAVVVDQQKIDVDIEVMPGATARGSVVDSRGRPIASATVRLGMPVRNVPQMMHKPTTTTRTGRFELLNLPPGEWLLEVELPERAGSVRPPVLYFPGVLQLADAGSIELVAGQTLDDITFVAPAIADNALIVRIVTAEQAMSQLDVSFVRVEPLLARPIAIDSEGTGTLTGLAPGRYFLTARGLSGGRIWTAYDIVDFGGDMQEVLLHMQRAARISGRITMEKGAATAFDGVRVGAAWVEDGVEINPLNVDEAAVSANGTFSFDGLFGTRKLQVVGLDPQWEIKSITQDRTDVTVSGLSLTADTEAKVVIVLGRQQQR